MQVTSVVSNATEISKSNSKYCSVVCLTFEYKWRRAFRHVSFNNKRSQADHFHCAIDNETLHTYTNRHTHAHIHARASFSYSDLYCFGWRCKRHNRYEAIKPCIILNNALITNLTPRGRKNCSFFCLIVDYSFLDDVFLS